MRESTILMATFCLLLHGGIGYAQRSSKRVHLRVESTLSDQTLIRLGDVAEITGFRPSVQQQLSKLDLADWSPQEDSIKLTRNQVLLRLQLALPSLRDIKLTGPEQIAVNRKLSKESDKPNDGPNYEQLLMTDLRSELASQWNVDVAAVRVRLLQPLRDVQKTEPTNIDRISTVLPDRVRPGTVRATFLSYSDSQLVGSQRLLVDVQLFAEVVCSARQLERGAVLGPDDIETNWQSIRSPQDYLSADDALGKTLRVALHRGQPVTDRHLMNTKSNRRTVGARDNVKVTSRSGSLVVALNNGVALQSGGIGDQIRVRNPNSGKIIVARVVSPTEVRVE